MNVIILAGGSGTRLWPLSRDRYPKQFLKFMGRSSSLFQETFLRSIALTNIDNIYIVTSEKYKYIVKGEIEELGYSLPLKNLLLEPEPKNTLVAIYYCLKMIECPDDDVFLVLPSDHLIDDNPRFVDTIQLTVNLSMSRIVTFGIKPLTPHIGYGYIEAGNRIGNGYEIVQFSEKPNLILAEEYIRRGFFWNSGMFMFRKELVVQEVLFYAPHIYDAFTSAENEIDAFSKIEHAVSFDYGIMEKTQIAVVVPADIGWNDLGSFDSFYDVFPHDQNHNVSSGHVRLLNASGNIISSENNKIIAGIGIEDLIIIDKRDALLICKKDSSQNVKEIVNALVLENDTRVEYQDEDYRPWGSYRVLEEEVGSFKIKKITVLPGKKLSYQLHYHRSEHWVVVSGMAKVVIEDIEYLICPGESIFMKAGQKHRLENPGLIKLEIIEVQMGNFLEENDIIRFDDDFGRGNIQGSIL